MNQPQVIESIFKFMKEFREQLDRELKLANLDYNPVFYKVLKLVASIPNCTAQKITTIFGKDKALVTRIIKEMVNLDLIEQERDKKDSRKKILSLTAKGRDTLITFQEVQGKLEKLITSSVSPEEIEVFLKVINSIKSDIS
ncbi:MarR family winged helix-turn-helix transcriptional regulator [Pseudoalteromonas sp. PS5]|uniref:MarR family winged helix-turn-helix transcriptional regulator n=1 Tax=Pseudoalteromonas sp. PS5 TaxID=1437473 RepID=UPI000FFE6A8F|nr:MarR family winged helix-turn-helix transcriptional regulator [Pseudoalteromonas sp. PS5]RXE98403.1 MarR family transcriptional regulator [Pseudoalteromonas sp. PS5]